jgi:hypothetical protein
VAVLQQSDLVAALAAPGILYLEGYTDLNLLREWARILNHPLSTYLSRTPYWQAVVWNPGDELPGIKAQDHFNALQLVKEGITGIWLLDADGKFRVRASEVPEPGKLNRIAWSRYETESYLVHPAALARFIDKQVGSGGMPAAKKRLTQLFNAYLGPTLGAAVADDFSASPLHPPQAIGRFLAETKARTRILEGILQEGGVHGMEYTEFTQIAAMMTPEEIHPEIVEKLDFIQQAFGL